MWLQYTSLCDKEDYTGAFRQALGIVDRYYRDRTLIFSAAVQGDSDVMALAILRSFWRLGSSLADEHHQLIEWLLEVIKPELIDDLSVDLSKIAIDFCISLVRSRQRGGIAELAVDCVKIFLKYSPMLQNVTYHQSIFKHISAILLDFDGQICKKQAEEILNVITDIEFMPYCWLLLESMRNRCSKGKCLLLNALIKSPQNSHLFDSLDKLVAILYDIATDLSANECVISAPMITLLTRYKQKLGLNKGNADQEVLTMKWLSLWLPKSLSLLVLAENESRFRMVEIYFVKEFLNIFPSVSPKIIFKLAASHSAAAKLILARHLNLPLFNDDFTLNDVEPLAWHPFYSIRLAVLYQLANNFKWHNANQLRDAGSLVDNWLQYNNGCDSDEFNAAAVREWKNLAIQLRKHPGQLNSLFDRLAKQFIASRYFEEQEFYLKLMLQLFSGRYNHSNISDNSICALVVEDIHDRCLNSFSASVRQLSVQLLNHLTSEDRRIISIDKSKQQALELVRTSDSIRSLDGVLLRLNLTGDDGISIVQLLARDLEGFLAASRNSLFELAGFFLKTPIYGMLKTVMDSETLTKMAKESSDCSSLIPTMFEKCIELFQLVDDFNCGDISAAIDDEKIEESDGLREDQVSTIVQRALWRCLVYCATITYHWLSTADPCDFTKLGNFSRMILHGMVNLRHWGAVNSLAKICKSLCENDKFMSSDPGFQEEIVRLVFAAENQEGIQRVDGRHTGIGSCYIALLSTRENKMRAVTECIDLLIATNNSNSVAILLCLVVDAELSVFVAPKLADILVFAVDLYTQSTGASSSSHAIKLYAAVVGRLVHSTDTVSCSEFFACHSDLCQQLMDRVSGGGGGDKAAFAVMLLVSRLSPWEEELQSLKHVWSMNDRRKWLQCTETVARTSRQWHIRALAAQSSILFTVGHDDSVGYAQNIIGQLSDAVNSKTKMRQNEINGRLLQLGCCIQRRSRSLEENFWASIHRLYDEISKLPVGECWHPMNTALLENALIQAPIKYRSSGAETAIQRTERCDYCPIDSSAIRLVLSSDNEEMLSRFIDGFNDDNFLLIMEAVVELEAVENPPCGLFKVLLRRMTCSETWMQQKGNATVVLSVRMVSIILKNCLKTFESNVLEFIRSDNFKRFTAAMEHLMKSNNSLDRAAAVSAALTLMMYYYPITPGLIDRKRLATMIIDAAEFSVVYEEDQSVQATISRQMNNRFGTTGDGERMNYLRCRHLLLNIF